MSLVNSRRAGRPRTITGGLSLMGVRTNDLFLPSCLRVCECITGILILASWLPLLHLVIANQVNLGRRFHVIENILPEQMGKGNLLILLAGFIIAATLVKMACSYWAERRVSVLTSRAEAELGEQIIRRHLRFGQSYYDAIKPGKTIKNILRLPARSARLIRWLVRLLSTLLVLLLYIFLMVWLSPGLAGISICLLVVYHLTIRRLLDRSENRLNEEDLFDDAADSETRDMAENLLLLRLHTPEAETVRAFRERADQRAGIREKSDGMTSLLDELRDGGNVMIMLIFVLIAGWALQGMEGGDIARYLVFFIVFRRAMRPFAVLQRLPRQWVALSANLDEVTELLADEGKSVVSSGHQSLDVVHTGISVRGLTFSYNGAPPVLHEINLLARKGELTVLVGPNGSGKSTLLKLFMRLYDVPPANLYIDGTDIREFDIESLRKKCGYTAAEPLLLNASLRENITIGLQDITDEHLWQVARAVGMDTLVSALEGGFNHEAGNRGMRLSQGQRQKVALARVLLRNPEIIFLDEASSSFDANAEKEMMARLVELAADRVVVAVTHRVSCIPPQAHVVVFREGTVVEDGYGYELNNRSGYYKKMLDSGADTREMSANVSEIPE